MEKKFKYTEGEFTFELGVPLPETAGRLSPEEVARIAKVRPGVGLVCEDVADGMERVGPKMVWPHGVTPAALREAGERAEAIDRAITGCAIIQNKLRQANLILDQQAYDLLRQVNDQAKAQGKFNPELLQAFESLTKYLARRKTSSEEPAQS